MTSFPKRPGAQMKVDVPCPACGSKGLDYSTHILEVPYFNEVVSTRIVCPACHYRHNDVFIVTEKPPQRFEYSIRDQEDLSVRIIRSTSGTLEVPQLGIRVEPAGRSEAFITNIEGVINRMEDAVNIALRDPRDQDALKKGRDILDYISGLRSGEKQATMILEDPMGNSAIIPPEERQDRLSTRPLTDEEKARLSTGFTIL